MAESERTATIPVSSIICGDARHQAGREIARYTQPPPWGDQKGMAAMLNYREAEQLALAWVEIRGVGQWELMREYTLSKPYGWVFFYQSREYIKTLDDADMLCGNAPILVDRIDGEIRVTGTARPIEHYLASYEASLPPARLQMTPEWPPA